jgi:hypothetical protein
MNTMEAEPIAVLRHRHLLNKLEYAIFPDKLVVSWRQTYGSAGRYNYMLTELSPDLGSYRGHPGSAKTMTQSGLILLGVSMLFYAYGGREEWIMVLMVVLQVVGVVRLVKGLFQYCRRETWTVIQRRDGTSATHLCHGSCDPQSRQTFELRLVEEIKRERSQHPARGDAQ